MTYTEELNAAERELDLQLMIHSREHDKLRAELVEKYGEEGVRKVEKQIEGEYEKRR